MFKAQEEKGCPKFCPPPLFRSSGKQSIIVSWVTNFPVYSGSSAPTSQPSVSSLPSSMPSELPSDAPSPQPSDNPTRSVSPTMNNWPSMSPSVSVEPSSQPSNQPSRNRVAVPNILTDYRISSLQGCKNDVYKQRAWQMFDGTTNIFQCTRVFGRRTVIYFKPIYGQRSIAKAIRVYAAHTNKAFDPVRYTLEGRFRSWGPWQVVSEGQLGWSNLKRNNRKLPIVSSYSQGDEKRNFTEKRFYGNNNEYLQYRVTFPAPRDPLRNYLRMAEIELPGLLVTDDPTSTPSG